MKNEMRSEIIYLRYFEISYFASHIFIGFHRSIVVLSVVL